MKRIYVDLQAADENTIGVGLERDLPQQLQEGEHVVLYDDELEVEAILHAEPYHGVYGAERYWFGTFDEHAMHQIEAKV